MPYERNWEKQGRAVGEVAGGVEEWGGLISNPQTHPSLLDLPLLIRQVPGRTKTF